MSTRYSDTKARQYDLQPDMPHDRDTERAVLATLMRYNEKVAEVSVMLSENLFYYDEEKTVYQAIVSLVESGKITDINAMTDWVKAHGGKIDRHDILDIMQHPSGMTLHQDIRRLRVMARRRSGWKLLQQAATNILDPMVSIAETANTTITELEGIQQDTADDGIAAFSEAVDELRGIVKSNREGGRTALMTGFYIFDNYFLLRPGTLTVIAAFTSVGKSALAMNITVNVAKENVPVAYYSLEMGKAELASRAVSKAANIPASIIMNKPLTNVQMADFRHAAEGFEKLPIFIDERSTLSFDKTVQSIRTMAKTRGVKLAVIDYLQIYTQTSDNVEASLAQMARQAKNVAKETGTAVVLLSQLNRSASHPSINMLRGSGQIEESADNIVLIDRPEAYPDNRVTKYEGEYEKEPIQGTAKFILAKGRGVGTGCDIVDFDAIHTTFTGRYHPEEPRQQDNEGLPF